MFFVLRRWVRWDLAAFVGGALYGFGPYVVAQGQYHLDLAFVPIPPLIFLATYETLRADGERPVRWGLVLGLLVTAQFFISQEIAATTLLIIGVSLVVLAAAHPARVVPSLARGVKGLLCGGLVVFGCIAYPVWAMSAGPYRYQGPAYPGGVNGDLLGTVAPTTLQHFAPGPLAVEGSKLLHGNISENGSYLGLALIALVVLLFILCRTRPWIRFAAAMIVITTVLSLGAHLTVANHRTAIPLPWDLVQHLPFADDIIAVRLSLFTAFFVALLVALSLDDLRRRRAPRGTSRWSWVRGGLVGIATLVSLLLLVPSWPLPTTPAAVPSFFSSSALDRVPVGSVALISPYPSVAAVQPQMWQAVAGMKFRIIGGYGLVPGPAGTSTNFPAILRPVGVERFLWVGATGVPYPAGRVPRLDSKLVCDFREFLRRNHVQTLLAVPTFYVPATMHSLFTRALGPPTSSVGGVDAWFGVADRIGPSRRCG
jgi:hypothetical protein